MNLTFNILVSIHFQKWSKVTVTDYDETIYTLLTRGLDMRLRLEFKIVNSNII